MIFVVSAGHPPGRLFCAGLRPGSSIMRLLSVVPVSALISVDTRRLLLMLRPLLSVCIVLLLMSRECGYLFIDRSSVSWLLVDDYCCSRCCRRRAILCSKCAAGWCCAACSGDGNIGKSAAAAAASAAAVDAVGIVFVVIDSRNAAAGGKYTLAQWLCRWRGAALRCMVVVIVMMTTTTGTVDGVGIANSGALRWLFVY